MAKDGRQHISTEDARGGETRGIVRYVLAISLAAIIVLFGVLLFVFR